MDATMDKVRVSRGGGKVAVASPRQALALIADKWAVLVITTLAAGKIRYNALRRELDGVSQKMLTQTLRDLECNGPVERTVYPDTPPRVEYGLTPLGRTLVEALTVLRDWANEHFHEVEAARLRVPEGIVGADDAERRAELQARRERVADALIAGLIDKPRAIAEGGAINAELDRLDGAKLITTIPQAVDWTSWTPSALNEVLRSMWKYVELGPDLRPVRAEWLVPEWRS